MRAIGDIDHRLSICTINSFYENMDDSVILMNEHDLILSQNAFRAVTIQEESSGKGKHITERIVLQGIWSLLNRKLFCFSATSSKGITRML
jgi:hypothetical protein